MSFFVNALHLLPQSQWSEVRTFSAHSSRLIGSQAGAGAFSVIGLDLRILVVPDPRRVRDSGEARCLRIPVGGSAWCSAGRIRLAPRAALASVERVSNKPGIDTMLPVRLSIPAQSFRTGWVSLLAAMICAAPSWQG